MCFFPLLGKITSLIKMHIIISTKAGVSPLRVLSEVHEHDPMLWLWSSSALSAAHKYVTTEGTYFETYFHPDIWQPLLNHNISLLDLDFISTKIVSIWKYNSFYKSCYQLHIFIIW